MLYKFKLASSPMFTTMKVLWYEQCILVHMVFFLLNLLPYVPIPIYVRTIYRVCNYVAKNQLSVAITGSFS